MIEILRGVPLLGGFRPEEIEAIAKRLETRAFTAGQVVIEEGASGDALHVILDGLFKVTRTDPETGATVLLATFGKGEVFGETALLIETPRLARVTAVMEGKTAAMTAATFESILSDYPGSTVRFLREIARTTIERLRRSLGDVIAATGFDPEAKETEYHIASLIRSKRSVRLHLVGGATIAGKIRRMVRGLGPDEIVVETRADEETIVPCRAIVFYEVEKKK